MKEWATRIFGGRAFQQREHEKLGQSVMYNVSKQKADHVESAPEARVSFSVASVGGLGSEGWITWHGPDGIPWIVVTEWGQAFTLNLFFFSFFSSHCTQVGTLAPGYFEFYALLWGSGAKSISAGFPITLYSNCCQFVLIFSSLMLVPPVLSSSEKSGDDS